MQFNGLKMTSPTHPPEAIFAVLADAPFDNLQCRFGDLVQVLNGFGCLLSVFFNDLYGQHTSFQV